MSRKYMQEESGQSRIAAAISDKEHSFEHGSLQNHSLNGPTQEFDMKDSYEVSDFLKLDDEAFLCSSYRAILGRMPDDKGREHFLSSLRNGAFTKTDILGRLRYSQEGRGRKVPVRGLLLRFLLNCLYKIPLLGYLVNIFTSVLTLPSMLKNFQVFESRTSAQHHLVSHSLDQKADQQLVEDLQRVLEQLAVQKADSVRVEEAHDAFTANIENIFKTIYEHTTLIMDQQRRLHLLLDEAKKSISTSMGKNTLETFASEYDHAHDALYVLFEEKFRGTREDIRQRLPKYLPFIQRAGAGSPQYPVLDLGCGRGEWLELLENTGLTAAGIDLNRVMVQQCRARNLQAEEADALGYLRSLPDGSLGALTSFHMIEHIPWRDVVAVFDEAFRVLRPGGCVIFETPNPENIIVASCTFYNDPSHVRPIPPATLEYLAHARGFIDATIMRSSPLHFFQTPPEGDMARMVDIFNCGQDYAVIAFKKNV
jgi:O-antigen chain-terminating methyltransferase